MGARASCKCCKHQGVVINKDGICMPCRLALCLNVLLTRHAGFNDHDAYELAADLHGPIVSIMKERLQQQGQWHPLALELEQWLAPRPEQRN